METKLDPIGKSSLGMDENIVALLSWLLGPIAGLIFFLIEKESKYVKYNALQSLIFGGAIYILETILSATIILIPIASLTLKPATKTARSSLFRVLKNPFVLLMMAFKPIALSDKTCIILETKRVKTMRTKILELPDARALYTG